MCMIPSSCLSGDVNTPSRCWLAKFAHLTTAAGSCFFGLPEVLKLRVALTLLEKTMHQMQSAHLVSQQGWVT